jgi:hypothetical protein
VPLVTGPAFAVVGSYQCDVIGRDPDDAEARARANLTLGEAAAVERQMMTGEAAVGALSFVGATDLTPPPGDPLGLVAGIATLEEFLQANYGCTGVIHAPVAVGAFGCQARVIEKVGQHFETCLGTNVAIGAGYSLVNQSPGGDPPEDGTAWLYATGAVQIWRSAISIVPDRDHSLNRANNDYTVLAERSYVVGWECVTAAVKVSLACCC